MQSFVTFFYLKTKQAKTHTHTLTQNVKQKHCLVVRKSSSQEEATTLGEVSPDKLRGRGHSRQIPHSSSSSSKRVLLPLFISKKKTCHGRQSYSRVFSPNRLNQSLETHTRTNAHIHASSIGKRRRNVSGGNRNQKPRRRNRCSEAVCVCEEENSIWLAKTQTTTTQNAHTLGEKERKHTETHTQQRE